MEGYMAGPKKDDGREDLMIFTSNWLSTTNLAEDNAKGKGGWTEHFCYDCGTIVPT